ncbi:MAG: 23S rRNA (guanosine(2251)-2'-O)-methyltransferase RlmB [Gammaproteobacteria bacterium]
MNDQLTEMVFGIHAVNALLKNKSRQIMELWCVQEKNNQRLSSIKNLAKSSGVMVVAKSRIELDEKTGQGNHQGIVALCRNNIRSFNEKDLEQIIESSGQQILILILDGVQDPHNLGACLRTADAAGVQAVVIPKDRAVQLTSVVRKVASGAAENIPLISVTNLSRTMQWLKEEGVWLFGADEKGESTIFDADLSGPVALVLGAEGKGLRRLTRENCDHLVSIPMAGSVSSLNVSVAAGVFLYEAKRQRL